MATEEREEEPEPLPALRFRLIEPPRSARARPRDRTLLWPDLSNVSSRIW
jgi:hypothetical protein